MNAIYGMLDIEVADVLGVSVKEYAEKIESLTEMKMNAIILGALSDDDKQRKQAKRMFNLIK